MAKVAYHYRTGAHEFPYDVDAHQAVTRHPREWKFKPWTAAETDATHQHLVERHERATVEAEALGHAPPPPPAPPVPLSPEDEEVLSEDAARREEAAAIVAEAEEKEQLAREEAEKVAAAKAVLESPPPQPQPARPFGRTGEPTPKERELLERRAAARGKKEKQT